MNSIPLDLFAAVIMHLCPFTHNGQHYITIPVNELRAVVIELGKEHALPLQFDDKMGLIIHPTTEGCTPDDGKNVPNEP